MIKAVLFIHGLGNHVNHGEWQFQELPRAGDMVHIIGHDGKHHYSTVRHVEHSPVSVHKTGAPESIIVSDWKSTHPADGLP